MPLNNGNNFDYSTSIDLYLAGTSPEGDLMLSAQALTMIREWIWCDHLDGEDLSNPYIQALAKKFKVLGDNTIRQPVAHAAASTQARQLVFTPSAPPAPMDTEFTSTQPLPKRCKGKQSTVL
ncbi:hypothetical protein BDN70DRAFT_937517 [Pholiota conissans]|uniref:Uncharacterized protein n=1 Tax=Pholiota conissans TaxID=109636 RepID=A0A9P6CTU1_9AGAR|nr:hypothetical protein BDN70DRAFT_937517 [Pholiota conissans]